VPNLKFLASTVCEILGGWVLKVDHDRNLKFISLTVREILGRSRNSKSGSRDPHMTPFDPILIFFSLEFTAVRLHAKFEVCSFNRFRDIPGGPQIPKLGHVATT